LRSKTFSKTTRYVFSHALLSSPVPASIPSFTAPRTYPKSAVLIVCASSQLNPDETFLELIQGLEDNRPTVDDWERRAILKGGTWIYDTLKPFAKGRGKKGKKGVDVMGLVGQLEEWVGAEWTGLRPREVVRVVGSEESGDEGENDGEGEGDGGEVEAVEEMKGEVVKMDVDEA
jgi:hypothetical protein